MSVAREHPIEWGGKTYSVTPTNKLLRRIEMQGVVLSDVLAKFELGQVQSFVFAFIAAELLKAGGAQGVTEEDLRDFLEEEGSEEEVLKLVEQVTYCIVPRAKSLPGKPVASGKRRKRKRK